MFSNVIGRCPHCWFNLQPVHNPDSIGRTRLCENAANPSTGVVLSVYSVRSKRVSLPVTKGVHKMSWVCPPFVLVVWAQFCGCLDNRQVPVHNLQRINMYTTRFCPPSWNVPRVAYRVHQSESKSRAHSIPCVHLSQRAKHQD